MMTLVRLNILAFVLIAVEGFDTEVVVLRAVRGLEARLPCGQGRVFLDGPDSYIMWLKNDRDLLYRFPNEDSDKRNEMAYTSNCDTNNCHDETALLLKHVSEQDGGLYRCRVHYQASPSVDYVIDVRLVDSPGTPRIYNDDGDEIKKGYVGPLSEGSDLTLICEVDSDSPDTLVYWRRNGVPVERDASRNTRRAVLALRNLTRDQLDAHYECSAQNADVTLPLTASVVVKMYLPPLSVEIRVNKNYEFEAGQPRVVDCVVVGCVPPPTVTWHLGEALLRPTVHKELHDGNYTVSSLTLAPSLSNNGQQLSCRAHNSHLPTELFENAITINVGFRPVCVTPRRDAVGAVSKEAETVSCVVEASPEPIQISWTFDSTRTLYTSAKKVTGHSHRYSSTLTWLPQDGDTGLLLCRATNAYGEQKRACQYHVVKGGPPEPPQCDVMRAYPGQVKVHCKKGWDGGRTQSVQLEVYSPEGQIVSNISSAAGHFQLPDVEEGRNFTGIVYASSVRGRSRAVNINLHSLVEHTASAAVTEDVTSHASPAPWVRLVEVTAAALTVAAAITTATICARVLRNRRHTLEANPDLVPRSTDGSFHREPDFAQERVLGTTNITVNQLASCPNQYSPSPIPCRVMVGCGVHTSSSGCSTEQQSYFV